MKKRLLCCAALSALVPFAFHPLAARAADAAAAAEAAPIDVETIVVTGTRFNADAAPAKASVEATQPQTVITRSYIENYVPPNASYVSVLAIAPSVTGNDVNGLGLSDGGAKNTLRGFNDQFFAQLFDGIPFGDTNGPSHHSLSYFPSSVIGSAIVDRGPGNAGNMSAATYGGTIKLFSEPLLDESHIKGTFGYGSFNTRIEVANYQTGEIGGGPTRLMINFHNESSDGALSFNDLDSNNLTIKANHGFGDNWTLTLFSSINSLIEHLNDNAGQTPAQVATYGKNFALQNTTPGGRGDYYEFNKTRKFTDMDYARLQGKVTDAFEVDNTLYTYQYTNHTFTATSPEQTQAEIAANVTDGLGTIVNGVKFPTDVPGYTKINEFRVWGDILRLSDNFQFGSVTGQVRGGLWMESSKTIRSRYDFDMTKCLQLGIDPFAVHFENASACADSSLVASGGSKLVADGYAEYNEHSSWYNYQPFLEIEIHPTDNLKITPGIKYVDWLHKINAGLEQKVRPIQPYKGEFTTKKTLPFADVNYKILPSWSVYGQYAQGIYVPDIGLFETKSGPTDPSAFPAPETSNNYQLGTVFYADNITFDTDVYLIKIKNNYSAVTCSFNATETCFVNTGLATYKGIEGETTYNFKGQLDGLVAFLSGSFNSAKSNGLWLSKAPAWTMAGGLLYKHNGWKFSVIDKATGHQFMDKTNTEDPRYAVPSYNTLGLSASYTIGHIEAGLDVNNALNSRSLVSITVNDKTFQTNRANSLDQYFYQGPLSVMGKIKVTY